jgi:hypothetical protein
MINTDGSVLFVPADNWSGTETLTFSASDKIDGPASDEVKVTITPVNDKPIAFVNSTAETAVLGKAFGLEGYGNDIDGNIVATANSQTLRRSTLRLYHMGCIDYLSVLKTMKDFGHH